MASTTTNLGLTKPAYSDDADISDINGNMDLIDAEAGRVRANVAANYDSSETYAVGDYCLHDGSLYKCSTAISSPEAWTAGHWTQIKITGELSALNGKMTIKNYGSSSSSTSVKNHIIGMMDDVIADTTFPTSAYCPIIKTLQGQDEYSGIAMKFDSSHGQLIVWDSSNHMYRCTRNGSSRYVGEFTGTNI